MPNLAKDMMNPQIWKVGLTSNIINSKNLHLDKSSFNLRELKKKQPAKVKTKEYYLQGNSNLNSTFLIWNLGVEEEVSQHFFLNT